MTKHFEVHYRHRVYKQWVGQSSNLGWSSEESKELFVWHKVLLTPKCFILIYEISEPVLKKKIYKINFHVSHKS